MDLIVLVVLGLAGVFKICEANSTTNTSKPAVNSRRTHDLVDEAFLEQKDVLLDMLESKLKEVRNKKKKKSIDKTDSNTITLESKCDSIMPSAGELKLSATGISGVGEVDAHLRFGETGKGTLKLNAVGISNVGRSHLDLAVEDGYVHIPGISNLFMGNILTSNRDKQANDEPESELKKPVSTIINRKNKQHIDTGLNDTVANVTGTDATESSGDTNVPTPVNINVNETVDAEAVKTNETVNDVV